MKELFIQLFGFVPSFLTLISMHFNDRRKVLALHCINALLFIIYYSMIGASTGVVINVVGLVRAIVCSFNDRKWASHKAWFVLFLVCFAVSPLLGWDGLHTLLMVAAMILTTFGLWTRDLRRTRLLMFCAGPLILLYDVFAGAWSPAIVDVVISISFALALWRFDIRPKRKQARQRADTQQSDT